MLKNTGYFRGITCPFSESCLRPHCVFRHGGRGAGIDRSGKSRTGAEYDPYSPDLPVVSPCMDKDFLGSFSKPSQHIRELEKVNKEIEEVKGQMERERRKYEELLESQNTKPSLQSESRSSSFEYDPGCSESRALCYNPNPKSQPVKPCKYSVANKEHKKSKSRHLEYIPTTVTNLARYRSNKYVIDNSKPYTDLEYDPMSNYSARHLGKVNPEKVTKRCRTKSQDESDAPILKKLCSRTTKSMVEARFSDSEDDSPSQTSPTIGKPLISDKNSISKSSGTEHSSRTDKEISVQHDIGNALNSREPSKKMPNPLEPKNEKTECKKDQTLPVVSSKKPCIGKDQKKASSKSHNKKKSEKVDAKSIDKLLECKPKKERPSEQTENKKNSLETLSKNAIIKHNKKDNEHKCCKEPSNKNGPSTKDGRKKDREHNAKKKKLASLDRSKKSCSAKKNQRALSHVDLFGDETSDEEENRKTGNQSNLTCNKDGKSTHKSKVAPRRNSVSSVESPDVETFSFENEFDSDSDVDPMEECLRVFNESHDIKTEDKGRMGKQPNDGEEKMQQTSTPFIPGQKRRISHLPSTNNVESPSTAPIQPPRRLNPQEICYQRIQKAQEQAAQLLAQRKTFLLSSITQETHSRKRIAKLSGSLSSIFCEKNAQLGTGETCNGSSAIKLRTPSGMASKTSSVTVKGRSSHLPSLQSAALKRPVLPTEFGAKVPTTVRQRYLNLFIDECLKFCQPQEEAFNKALEEEKMVYTRSSSRNIYLNVAVNTLKKLRSQGSGIKTSLPNVANKKSISHESVLGGKLAAKVSFSVQRSNHQDEELTESTLYNKLKKYVLTPEQLKENSYPLLHPETSESAVVLMEDVNKNSDTSCKICCRCGAEYLVTPKGNCVRQEECVHHWGRLRRLRVPGGWETHYSCCSGAVGSAGCQVAKQHVQDGRKDSLIGFVKTFEKLNTSEGSPGVFALDCEMCYTTKGLELTRVTVINYQLKVIYDTFVIPDNRIVDYNTRFSGVTEEDLQNTTITLRDVQAVLLSMFSCDSILIGHSLESDLFALKLIHPTVVDTAIVFPHRLGLPYKRALRSLMADHLKRIIQDNVDGHDSSEDACSCMELMIWRLKEDAKVKR